MGKHTSEIFVHLDLVTLCILTGQLVCNRCCSSTLTAKKAHQQRATWLLLACQLQQVVMVVAISKVGVRAKSCTCPSHQDLLLATMQTVLSSSLACLCQAGCALQSSVSDGYSNVIGLKRSRMHKQMQA